MLYSHYRRYEGVQYTQYLYKHKKCLQFNASLPCTSSNMSLYVMHCKYRENIWDGKGMDIKKAPEGANSYFLITEFIFSTSSLSTDLQPLSPLKLAVIIISLLRRSVIVAEKVVYTYLKSQ